MTRTSDVDVRIAVTAALLAAGHPPEAIRHEITLESSSSDGRADMVLALDSALVGIEIKSGRDTLERLDSQRGRYERRFDRLCLVLDVRHEPTDWGGASRLDFGALRIAEQQDGGGIGLRECRHGYGTFAAPWEPPRPYDRRRGPGDRQAPAAMLSMLWAEEVYGIAAELVRAGLVPAAGGGQRYWLIPHLAEHAAIAHLRPRIAAALRARPLNRWEESFWPRFAARHAEGAAA